MASGPNDGRAYTALYRSIASNQAHYHDESYSWWSYSGDTLFFNSSTGLLDLGNPVLFSGPLPISDVVGLRQFPSERSLAPFPARHKPIQPVYNWDVDAERYSSLQGLPAFYGRVSHREADKVERNVIHTRYNGSLGQADWGLIHHPSVLTTGWWNTVPRLYAVTDLKYDWVSFNGVTRDGFVRYLPHSVDRTDDITTLFDCYDLAMLDCSGLTNPERSVPGGDIGQPGIMMTYLDIVNHSHRLGDSWHVDISYTLRLWRGSFDNFGEYHVHILFDCGFKPTDHVSSTADMLIPQADTFWLNDQSSVTAGANVQPEWILNGGWRVGDRFTVPSLNTNFSRPIYQVDETYISDFIRFHSAWGGDRLASVRKRVDDTMRDIRPSSFLAASDALDKGVLLIQNNMLQNLQHLKDLLGLLPDLSKFAEVAAKITSGDPSAIIDFIDLLTEEVLKQRFQREPITKAAKELLSADIATQLGPLLKSQYRTLYGSYSFEFQGADNFIGSGRLVLETRAKVRVYFDVGTALAAYLTANSVGLLPTLARIWSLLPFSFVVDWFTNMSKRLKLVDNQLLYVVLGINWCLWSYKVTWYPSEADLLEYNLKSIDPDKPFCITVYQREFSHWMPKLSESRFDFLRPTRTPDPVTVGSLIWQLSR